MQAAGLLASLDIRRGKSHTQVFIEDPFSGEDYMCDGLSAMVAPPPSPPPPRGMRTCTNVFRTLTLYTLSQSARLSTV